MYPYDKDQNSAECTIFMCLQSGVARIIFFLNAKCKKKSKKCEKRSFSIVYDQYLGEKVDVVEGSFILTSDDVLRTQ
jgi:hypothetical protein